MAVLVVATLANKSDLMSTKATRKSDRSKVYGLHICRKDQVSSTLIAKLCGLLANHSLWIHISPPSGQIILLPIPMP